jgi:hypothetical protein
MSVEISNTDEVINIRDMIDRVESLPDLIEEAEGGDGEGFSREDIDAMHHELKTLIEFLDDIRGEGVEVWRASRYPQQVFKGVRAGHKSAELDGVVYSFL